jgi:putative transposase
MRSREWNGVRLPRLPDKLEVLDTLLVMAGKPRVIRRYGTHVEGLRFLDPTLAAFVGEPVTIRYDPRDMGEIRVFHRNDFLCRAVNAKHADRSVTLKDVSAARSAHPRKVRLEIKEKRERVSDLLPAPPHQRSEPPKPETPLPTRPRLRIYAEDR